jgi:dihydroxyacetone kinase-like predicted kinase
MCDGAGLLGAFRAAVANLEAHVDEINALNVFPVPDGDTGSNMLATVRAALEEAEGLGPGGTAGRVAAAAAFGALMGARGNSGVITSQILRGLAEGLADKTRFNALDLADALDRGTKAAYGAVAKPVEGTILTVVREASAAAVAAAERDRDLAAVLGATVEAAHGAVAKTPSLLAILKEAGVVDSGGQGLYRLLQGTYASATGRAASESPEPGATASLRDRHAAAGTAGRGGPPAAAVRVAAAQHGFGEE